MEQNNVRIPKQKRSLERKNQIKQAALELFSEKGYHKTTTNEIAARAGIPIGSIYSYFQDKKALYEELLKDLYDHVQAHIYDTPLPAGDVRTVIRQYVETVMESHTYLPEFQREVASLSQQYEEFRSMEEKYRSASGQMGLSLLNKYQPYLRITDYETAEFILLSSVEAVVHEVQLFPNSLDKEKVITELTDLMCRYLLKDECFVSPN